MTARFFAGLCKLAGEVLRPAQVLETVADGLHLVLAARRVLLVLAEDLGNVPVIGAWRGLSPGAGAAVDRLLPPEILAQLAEARQPFAAGEGWQPLRFLDRRHLGGTLRPPPFLLGAPVLDDQDFVGVVAVDRLAAVGGSPGTELEVLTTVAEFLAGLVKVQRSLSAREERWRWENLALAARLAHGHESLLVGQSPAVAALRQLLKRVAESRAPVLLVGEPGVGKTLAARLIHEMSPRRRQPFVRVNCAALPEPLLSAELLGRDKGVGSEASRGRPGRLGEAEGGTLLLTGVERLPSALQGVMLRLLEDREYQRLGGAKVRKADVRLLAATQEDLAAAVAEGRFLAELYQKLSLFTVPVPSLRQRSEDILPLLNHFLDQASRELGRRFYLTRRAEEVLTAYAWPGNVRELKTLVERLTVLAEGPGIDATDLPAPLARVQPRASKEAAPAWSRLKELERQEIIAALERHQGVQSQAALELGLTLRQMGYRIKQFGLLSLVKKGRSRSPAHGSRH